MLKWDSKFINGMQQCIALQHTIYKLPCVALYNNLHFVLIGNVQTILIAFLCVSMDISIDKIKLKGVVNVGGVQAYFDKYSQRNSVDVTDATISTALNRYKYVFTVYPVEGGKRAEGAFFVAFSFNGSYACARSKPNECVVEFNPNKCPYSFYQDFVYFSGFKIKEVCSIDLAFDIPLPKSNVYLANKNYSYMAIGNSQSITEYLCYNQKHSRLKVYDKGAERKTSDVLTRVEVTISKGLPCPSPNGAVEFTAYDYEQLKRCCSVLSCVRLVDTCDDSLISLMLSCDNNVLQSYLATLPQRTRTRWRKKIKDSTTCAIEIDELTLSMLIAERLADII